jgi:hypothetical protein
MRQLLAHRSDPRAPPLQSPHQPLNLTGHTAPARTTAKITAARSTGADGATDATARCCRRCGRADAARRCAPALQSGASNRALLRASVMRTLFRLGGSGALALGPSRLGEVPGALRSMDYQSPLSDPANLRRDVRASCRASDGKHGHSSLRTPIRRAVRREPRSGRAWVREGPPVPMSPRLGRSQTQGSTRGWSWHHVHWQDHWGHWHWYCVPC